MIRLQKVNPSSLFFSLHKICSRFVDIKFFCQGWRQCDKIWQFITLWATFQSPGQQLFCRNCQHILGNFCKGVKIFHYSREIPFGQLLQTFGDFLLFTVGAGYLICGFGDTEERRNKQCDQISPKISHSSVYSKFYVFQNSPKIHEIFGLFLLKNCCKELSKVARSGHTATTYQSSQLGPIL